MFEDAAIAQSSERWVRFFEITCRASPQNPRCVNRREWVRFCEFRRNPKTCYGRRSCNRSSNGLPSIGPSLSR